MKIPFRHGLVRYQKSGTIPTFLNRTNSGSTMSLVVSTDSTYVAFAHGSSDYLFEEKRSITPAWNGPFVSGVDYWLYWDIDMLTGQRTFGHTEVQPVLVGAAPLPPVNDQHWFDHSVKVMKVWNLGRWNECLRVFACFYDEGTIINAYPTGTQVGNLNTSYPGFILFDDNSDPIRRLRGGNRRSEFITSESIMSSQVATGMANISIESKMPIVEAIENIPEYRLVSYRSNNKIGIASYLDPNYPVVGLVRENMFTTEVGTFTSSGEIVNENWNFTTDPNTPLFCGVVGEVTTSVPQQGAYQQVGFVISPTTIFLDIEQQILYQ